MLKSVPALADVAVFNQRPREAGEAVLIQQAIDAALMGMTEGGTSKAGLSILVQLPDGEVSEREAPGPQLDAVLFIRVTENPLVNEGANGTGLHAEDAALAVLSALHHWHRDGRALYADKRAIRDGDTDENGLIEFDVVVRSEIGGDVVSRVAAPSVSVAVGYATLTTSTSGASIYYTTDGSAPLPANAEAQLYSAPFAIPSGTVLRAAAIKPPLNPSFITRVLVTYDPGSVAP